MSKKLYFLVSFVLVLSLGGLAQAGTPVDVNNYSFEWLIDGNSNACHTGLESVLAWEQVGPGYAGVDVNCGWEGEECTNCHDWVEYPNGNSNLYYQGTTSVYQILDHNIVYGHKYIMTVDLMAWDPMVLELFALEDVCNPDVNHLLISSSTIEPDVWENMDVVPTRWMYEHDVELEGVITDVAMVGKKLGIKFGGTDADYRWVDNVRMEYEWASNAYDPDPPDEGEDVNSQALTLSWMPGLWAVNDVNGHEVYFGTSESEVEDANTSNTSLYPGVYRGSGVGVVTGPDANNRYSYVIPGGDLPFALGETYFWRIDEVNDDYVGPIPQPWKGDVWSFMVEGRAKAVYPADMAEDIPALGLILRWEAGAGAAGHDVYFGSDEAAVEDANTNTAGIYRGPTQALADVNYLVEDLDTAKTYYWRIDEVNNITTTFVKGDVWGFTTGVFLIVDSFEPYRYADKDALRAVWTQHELAEIFPESADANKFLNGEQSMKFYYRNMTASGGKPVGSTAEANLPLEVGTNWTAGGVKALVVNYCGDTDNGQEDNKDYCLANDRMWISLLDGGSNEGIVRYDKDHNYDMNDIKDGEWHEWNISLRDPCLIPVDMNNVAKVYIGFGGVKGGALTKHGAGIADYMGDTVWFDDISLYPPRCMPELTGLDVLRGLGDLVGGGEEGAQDCNTNYLDLELMAQAWNMRGMWAEAGMPTIGPIIEYLFDEGSGTTTANTGSYTNYELTIGRGLDVNGLFFEHPNHAPLWVDDPCRGICLSFDGEAGMWPGREPTKDEPNMFGGDYLVMPPLNTADNSMSITAWIKPDPFCEMDKKGNLICWFKDGFTGIVVQRTNDKINPSVGSEADGLNFAGGSGFVYDGMLGYTWNDNDSSTWNWNSDIFPVDRKWNFVAVVIEPSKATVYMGDPNKNLQAAVNPIEHTADLLDAKVLIGGDIGQTRFFRGLMDDIRIYDYSLTAGHILGLAGIPGTVYIPCTSVADIVEGDKAPTDPCAPIDDQVDFVDYAKLAEHWLEKHPWP